MKKHQTRQKTLRDPVIVMRVKNYLAENVDKTYVDVSQMARTLKERYREYSNRSDSAFCQMVENAYKVVLQRYGIERPSSSEDSEEETGIELLDENSSALNDRLIALYKMQHNKRSQTTCRATDKSGKPIDILSSDEDSNSAPKIRKINDQITTAPTTNAAPENLAKHQQNEPTNKKKQKLNKNKSTIPKNKVDFSPVKDVKVSFDDIGGISDIITQVCDLVIHMKRPELYAQLGIKAPRGALLHGPPGTGKTLIAHAIAGILQLPLIAVSGTELVGGLSGESEERIRELFESAVSVAPCVLFIDEIDAVCGSRINAQKDMEKRMVSQLLTSLDQLSECSAPVLVLAATNNPDVLDPALRRAGRLEQEIALGIPSLKARKEILAILCKKLSLSNDIDMNVLAQITPGFVGADLQALVNKASTYAVKRVFGEIQICNKKKLLDNTEVNKAEEVTVIPNEDVSKEAPKDTLSVEKIEQSSQVEEPEATADSVNESSHIISNHVTPVVVPEIKPEDHVQEILTFLKDDLHYTTEQLKGLSVRQDDFLKALKTTKPCAVREGIVTVPDVTWDDVGSLNEVRKDLQLAVLAPVKYSEQLKDLGMATPSGVLLCGPPGCGKTLLAKAVANEAGVNFISVKGPELLNMYVGESERAVRTCFRRARNSAPCVIFFDEFDALCPRRSSEDNNGATRVVNQLLTEMDGIELREGVFVLAATNRPDIIDPAVLRPGRLDEIIYVGMPGIEDRFDILQKLTKGGTKPPLAPEVNLHVIAELTEGYTGADLSGLVKAAVKHSLKKHIANNTLEGGIFVTFEDFTAALRNCKPSVSLKESLYYQKLKLKYARGDDKEMEIKTELANEESMDTV